MLGHCDSEISDGWITLPAHPRATLAGPVVTQQDMSAAELVKELCANTVNLNLLALCIRWCPMLPAFRGKSVGMRTLH